MNVITVDTTNQSDKVNRVKVYINGTQETSFEDSTYPSLNLETNANNSVKHWIGAKFDGSTIEHYYDGYLSYFHLVDGSALDPTNFGETKNNVFIPNNWWINIWNKWFQTRV